VVRARHLGLIDEDRDHTLAELQRGGDFDADEIAFIFEAALSFVVERADPALAYDRKEDVALSDLIVQHLNEIVARIDVALHIHEQILAAEFLLEAQVESLRETGIVAAAVTNEYLSAHLPCRKPPRHAARKT